MTKGLLTAPALHLQVEAMRRAYLDRARFLGDPDFVKVPVAELTSKSHAKQAASTIDLRKASSSAELGQDMLGATPAPEPDETTHFSVVDRSGMAVASTYTLEGGFGSHVVVKGAGFILNNEMGDFNRKPGDTNATGDIGTPANLIAPGKRMLSSMTPTIVTKNGKLVLVTGSPGRPDDHQHRADRRARRHRVRPHRPGGRRSAAPASSVAAGPVDRGRPAEAAEAIAALKAMGHDVRTGSAGRRADDLDRRRRHAVRRHRQAHRQTRKASVPIAFDSAVRPGDRLSRMFRARTTRAPSSFLLWRAGRGCACADKTNIRHTHSSRPRWNAAGLFSFGTGRSWIFQSSMG